MCTFHGFLSAVAPFTHSLLSTNAHVLGGTSALRKSGRPQTQFHIIEYAIEVEPVPDLLTSSSVPRRPASQPVPDKLRLQRHQPVSHGLPRLRKRHGGISVFDMISTERMIYSRNTVPAIIWQTMTLWMDWVRSYGRSLQTVEALNAGM